MSAAPETLTGKALEDAVWLLETRSLIRAYLEYEHQFEHLADAIDPLQEFAETSGLVAAIGQDRVQEIIAKHLERFRAIVAAVIAAELEPALPSDYASQLVRAWELADPRDRWKWTGEMPPAPSGETIEKPVYRTPQATIDAFTFVLSTGDADRIDLWLRNHLEDVPTFTKLLEAA